MSDFHDPTPTADDSAWLLNLILTLDRAADKTSQGALNRRLSATLCVAFADAWIGAYPCSESIARKTVLAATDYLASPDDTSWTAFFRAATSSYAFGPGDGCHTVLELGAGCGAGSGCRTGIGWIWGLVAVVGAPAVRERILATFGGELTVINTSSQRASTSGVTRRSMT